MLKDKRFSYILKHEHQYKGNTVKKAIFMESLYDSDIRVIPVDETEEEFLSGRTYYLLKVKYVTVRQDEKNRWTHRVYLKSDAAVAVGSDLSKVVAAVDKFLTEKEGLGKRYPWTKRSLHKLEARFNDKLQRQRRYR